MALLDEIKKRLGGTPLKPTAMGAQAGASKILGVKATGKAAGGPAPVQSSVATQVAEQQAGQQMAEVVQTNQVAAQQLGQQQAQVEGSLETAKEDLAATKEKADAQAATKFQMGENSRLARQDEAMATLTMEDQMQLAQLSASYNNVVARLASDKGLQRDEIFQAFRQGEATLDQREDSAELEQLAFTMRMADNQYIDHINRVAKLQGLEDDLAFREEATRLRLGNNTVAILGEIGYNKIYNASAREFSEATKNMTMETAMNISDAQIRDEGRQQMVAGVTEGAKIAVTEYAEEDS